jgi:eukaryotic-like serine/threonine-protein kinase
MSMLAKEPESRPESARHVADRADVIRDARAMSGAEFRGTADLPVVPDYPTAAVDDYPSPERSSGSPLARHRLAAAGMGVALCGVGAIVAVAMALSSGGHPPAKMTSATKSASAQPSLVRPPATATVRTSQAVIGYTGTNLETTPETFPTQSAQPTASRSPSPTSTPDASPSSAAPPTTPAPSSASPSTSATPSTSPSTTPSPGSSPAANTGNTVGETGPTAPEG